MHIIFLTIGTFSQNAMMKRVKGLAPHIIAAGHQVTIVLEDTDENREYFSSVEAEKAFFSGSGIVQEIRQKVRMIRNRSPDVVYACGWGLRNGAALMGNTSIIEHAEMLSSFPSAERGTILRGKDYLMEWISITCADGLVLASEYLFRNYQNNYLSRDNKMLRLPYGLEGSKVTGKGGIEKKEVTRVVYMGTLRASYGIFDIVDSVPHLLDAGDPVEYMILGDGPERKEAIARAQSLGVKEYIRFEGYVSEDVLEERLASADVFLAPMFDTVKDKARCPSKIPMYMRYQKPIVSCRVGEVPTYLAEDGYYYAPGEPKSMAKQILKAAQVRTPINYDIEKFRWKQLSKKFITWLDKEIDPQQHD